MNKITGRELDPNQFPAWAEFTPSSEALTKVSPRAGFEIEVLIDQVSGGVTTKAMARVGAGIIESGYVSGRGWYVKYGDGTMIQWGTKVTSGIGYNAANSFGATSGQSYYNGESDVVYLPTNFYDTNFSVTTNSISETRRNYNDKAAGTLGRVYVIQNPYDPTNGKPIDWTAIGRWKA